MAIRFRCNRCRQLLGIASRKAGSEIRCPKCGISQVVPSEEAAAAALAMDQFAKNHGALENPADLVVYDDQPAAIETPRPPRADKGASGTAPPGPQPELTVQPGRPVPQGMILYPRKTFYVEGLLFVILAAVAFGSGYLIGRGDANYRQRLVEEEKAREKVLVEGTLFYNPGTGEVVGDQDAVVIALPQGNPPETPISFQGIRPQDPPPGEGNRGVRKIRQLGGAYARANAEGRFDLVLPDQGKYYLLIISAHASRAQGSDVDEADLLEMERYFKLAQHLISRYEYRWKLEDVNVGFNPIKIEFGRQG